MAVAAPDPKTFGSWEDAFQFPIATVRGMERQLRNDIDSNGEKLSSLVGFVIPIPAAWLEKDCTDAMRSASYRDLLGTAESIVEMDGQMQKVEAYLADMGVKCNSRLLEKKAANLKAWDNDMKADGTLTICATFTRHTMDGSLNFRQIGSAMLSLHSLPSSAAAQKSHRAY